ncbi:MAG: hypothetical protein ABMB14_23350 [Myxococcota bacterium]
MVTGVGWRDLALVGGCAAFAVLSGIAFVHERSAMSAMGVVAFGGAAVLLGWLVVERIQFARQVADPAEVAVAGGVPLRVSRRRSIGFGLWLVVLGAALVAVTPQNWLVGACAVPVFGAGVALLVGRLPRGADRWLQFDRDGLRLGTRAGSAVVPWDAIGGAQGYELEQNLLLAVRFDPRRLIGDPAILAGWCADGTLRIRPWAYGLPTARLGQAIARYATDPRARDELRPMIGG